jgi:amidase
VIDTLRLTAEDVSGLLERNEVAGEELTGAYLEAIEERDPELHAYLHVVGERGAGVPIAHKDVITTKGVPTTAGSRILEGYVPVFDSTVAARCKEAGLPVLGKTNLDEFAMGSSTENSAYGPSRNPWDPERVPGGSSGGSAAAVAAGLVSIAHANDGGGSLRIPAACCGLVGLKPSRGRISRGPDLGDSFLASDGVLTRTVAETALLLDVLAGYEPGDATWAPRPAEPYTLAMRRNPGKLRIAMSLANALDVDADPEVVHGLHSAAALLRDLGHEVVDASPSLPGPDALDIFLQVFGPGIALGITLGERLAGRPPDEDEIEPLSRAVLEHARALPSTGYLTALAQLQLLARGTVAFFADYDLLMTPVLATRPLPIGELHGCGDEPLDDLHRSGRFAPYTALFNVTGQPAISLPVGFGEDGLPTAVQLVGHPIGEETLLQVAAQVEAARPWAGKRPLLSETSSRRPLGGPVAGG